MSNARRYLVCGMMVVWPFISVLLYSLIDQSCWNSRYPEFSDRIGQCVMKSAGVLGSAMGTYLVFSAIQGNWIRKSLIAGAVFVIYLIVYAVWIVFCGILGGRFYLGIEGTSLLGW